MHWIFVVANVFMPVISIDLPHDCLLIDTCERRLVDGYARLYVYVTFLSGRGLSPVTVKQMIDPYYQRIFNKYPELYETQPKTSCATSNATHNITTTERPGSSRVHRLTSEMLRLTRIDRP